MKFRKLLVALSAIVMGLSLTGCAKKSAYVGLGYVAKYSGGTATVTGAMASFDKSGKILDARIDVVQVKVVKTTEATGVVALNGKLNDKGYVNTKCELGTNYNMVKYGAAIAEVDNQIEAYADWCVGKTAAEVKAAQAYETMDKGHKEDGTFTTDKELFTKCTITVDAFSAAIESAWNHKVEAAVSAKAVAGISLIGNISEASHGKGYDQVTVDMGGVLVESGKVVAAQIDAITFSFKLDNGELVENQTTKYYDSSKNILSKKVLGDKYAMADKNHPAYSNGCTLEWYEQAANIETYAVGKTAAEIAATAAKDAITGATITYTAYTLALSNAAKYAEMEHIGPQA